MFGLKVRVLSLDTVSLSKRVTFQAVRKAPVRPASIFRKRAGGFLVPGISDRAVAVKGFDRRRGPLTASAGLEVPGRGRAPATETGSNVERPTGRTTLTPTRRGAHSVRNPRQSPSLAGGTQRDRHQAHRSGRAGRRAGCRASLRTAEGAWWVPATARRVQSLSRPRHRGGSHADSRTRALAVSDPAHLALSARARERISPSRRP